MKEVINIFYGFQDGSEAGKALKKIAARLGDEGNKIDIDAALKRAIERNTDLEAKKSLLQSYNIPCFDGSNIQDIVFAMKKVNSDLNWKGDPGDCIIYCYLLDCVVGIDFANQFHEYLERMGRTK